MPPTEPGTLLPLYVHPATDPQSWRHATAAAGATDLTVVVRHDGDDPAVAGALSLLAAAGIATLGHVDLRFATRPVAALRTAVAGWARCPVVGIFLDQAPTSPYSIGPVALTVRAARRAGLPVVLNPAGVPDPLYRQLDSRVCTFEGPWDEYRAWSGEGSRPGDGHLVHSVPPAELPQARALLRRRRAGFGLVTDRTPPQPYDGVPSWLADAAGAVTT
jgi:hypothetical protein